MTQPYTPVRFAEKFALFAEQWSPRIIAEMNDYQFKLVRIAGDFVWHMHADRVRASHRPTGRGGDIRCSTSRCLAASTHRRSEPDRAASHRQP
ncbi:hypothetical protein FHS96_004788 [Sphingomonas zeicaulis]|uniref:hypothetical protein n=1 Tax=Sphingomonas zeicaulis TaxID=1632740 RepID=UPI003D1B92DA